MHGLIFASTTIVTAAGRTVAAGRVDHPRRRRKIPHGIARLLSRNTSRPHIAAAQAPANAKDRQRIVADLHDGALQLLAGGLASLRLAERLLAQKGQEHPAAEPLKDGIHLMQAAVCEIRSVLFGRESGSPDTRTLAACVQRVLRHFAPAGPPAIHLNPLPDLSGSPAVEHAVAGIIGEALVNAIKHAQARNVWVEVSVDGELVTGVVRDDGVGFDLREIESQAQMRKTLGLALVKERARSAGGLVTISSRPGSGTVVEAKLPLVI